MALGVTTPYYAPDIPLPLPSEAEIHAAADITEPYIWRRVVQVGSQYVVKFGKGVELAEGENMLFVREHTNVPIPRVYAFYSEASIKYIVMERIDGSTLLSVWPQLDDSEKSCIATLLRSYVDELRDLQSPGYYGSIGERAFLDGIFWTQKPEPAINGPFTSELALIEALALKYTYDGRSTYRADFYRQCLPHVLGGHPPIFTHGDFQRKNIIILKRDERQKFDAENVLIFVIDWEKSGWYPSYWEYCLAVCSLRWDDDWCLWLGKTLHQYDSAAAWVQAMRLELWS